MLCQENHLHTGHFWMFRHFHPSKPTGDAMHMRVHTYAYTFPPCKVHHQYHHFRTNSWVWPLSLREKNVRLSFLTTKIVVKLPCKDRRSSGERGISPPHDLQRVVHVERMCIALVLWKETGRMIIASASLPPCISHHCSKARALSGFRSIVTFS